MTQGRDMLRSIALAAAVLLLWCHALDASFGIGRAAHAPRVPVSTAMLVMGAPAPAPHEVPQVSCCFGGTGTNLAAVSLTRLPVPEGPRPGVTVLAAVPAMPASAAPQRPLTFSAAPARTSLVAQAVLMRI